MRLFAWLGSLVVLVIAAAFIIPPFVDWNQFSSRFEAEATRVLGQRVEVRGTTSARLLPVPSVTFTDIRVGPEDAPHLVAGSFAMDVDLAPLLKGDVVIRDMRLNAPRLNVRIDENGRLFGEIGGGTVQANAVSADNIRVTKGVIRFVDDRIDRDLILRNIDLTASATALSGPWRADGKVTWQDERFELGVTTGRWREDGAISVKADVEPQAYPFDFRFEGLVGFQHAFPRFIGRMIVERAVAQTAQERTAFPRYVMPDGLPVRIEADFNANPDELTVPAYELRVGEGDDPYTITGTADMSLDEVPSFTLTAQGQQIDLERLGERVAAGDGTQARTFQQRMDQLAGLLQGIPRFKTKGVVKLELPAIVADDTIIRDVRVDVQPVAGRPAWQLDGLEAELPGRTALRADGVLSLDPSLGFAGQLAVATSQPSGFAKWLGAPDNGVISAMRNAGFEAEATIGGDGGAVQLDDLELILDGSRLNGSMTRRTTSAGRNAVELILRGEKADFDQLAAWAKLFTGNTGVTAVDDLRLDLDVERAAYDGLNADAIIAKGVMRDGRIDLDLLEIGDLAGVSLSANGELDRPDRAASGDEVQLTVALSADDISRALALLEKRLPTVSLERFKRDAALFDGTDLVVTMASRGGGFTAEATGETGGTQLELNASLSDDQRLNARLLLESPQAATLLAQVGVPVLPDVGNARGGLRLSLNGPLDGPLRSTATLTMPTGYASAEGDLVMTVQNGGLSPRGTLDVKAEASNLDPFIAMSGLPFPGFGGGRYLTTSFQLALTESGAEATDLTGSLVENPFRGRLAVERDLDGKPVVTGSLSLKALSAPLLAQAALSERQLFDGLSGAVSVEVDRLSLGDSVDARVSNAHGQLMFEDGDLAVRDATGRWLDGEVRADLSLARSGDNKLVGGTLALQAADAAQVAEVLGLPPFIKGRFEGSGSFEATAESEAALLPALTGSGSARVTNGRLLNIAADTLAQAMKAADSTDDAALPEQAAAIIRDALLRGELSFGETEFPFAIAGGTARVTNVPFASEGITARGQGRRELGSGTYDARLDVTFDAGRAAVVGSTPALTVDVAGKAGSARVDVNGTEFETFLNMRLAARREREFAARQAAIAQRQRLADTVRLYQLKAQARKRAEEEAARIEQERAAEAARKAQEAREQAQKEAARQKAAEAARKRDALLRQKAQQATQRLQPPAETLPVLEFDSLDLRN